MSTKTLQTSESTQTTQPLRVTQTLQVTQPTEPLFLSHLVYEPETGSFFTKTKDTLKYIIPDEDGFLLFPVKVAVGATKVSVKESNESSFNTKHNNTAHNSEQHTKHNSEQHTKHKTKYIKIKAIKAGYLLYFKQLGKPIPCIEQNQVLYSKNLNKLDLRFCNIGLCSRAVLLRINEAQRNLQGDLKLLLHPKDMFSYVVHWTEDGQKKKKVVHDVVLAKKMHLRLQLKFSKVLAKYLVLD